MSEGRTRVKPPRFTDSHRFPRPYRNAADTDISRSWADARKRIEADKAERARIVTELKPLGRKKA